MDSEAGREFWDSFWTSSSIPKSFHSDERKTLNNYFYHKLHHRFCNVFSTMHTSGKRLLEIGCGGSVWLPYFSKQFGFEVWGIDYSEIGCKLAEQILIREKAKGQIVYGDFFCPPDSMTRFFDVVISFGVVEHFRDPRECVTAISKFLRPGGIMITVIPNFMGISGLMQKQVNRSLFHKHIRLSKETLKASHEYSGLKVNTCEYFLYLFFSGVGLYGIKPRSAEWYFKKLFLFMLLRFSKLIYTIDEHIIPLRPGAKTGAYIICLSQIQK